MRGSGCFFPVEHLALDVDFGVDRYGGRLAVEGEHERGGEAEKIGRDFANQNAAVGGLASFLNFVAVAGEGA
ncbi:MAG TPA: hypothetical protein VEV37_04970 [Bryobacteraceae bacterium]|nr:hypothetical protein [Bryobacteraceae bacterium]